MLAEQVRSGLVETRHDGAVAVVAGEGSLLAAAGDIDRSFFIRSSAKPFQATVSQETGAELTELEMAMACASHRGFPVHLSLVRSMLERAGLDESALQCPADWPLAARARDLLIASGAAKPRREWHNCSGKHAAFLRACVAAGWPTETYLSPDHPLQRRVISLVSELGELSVEPVGVDGCGAPVLRTTVRAMALMFARLATESRLRAAFGAMHRYPALVGANGAADTEIAIATNSAVKGGAAGCLGLAVDGRAGVAVKSWDGLGVVAGLAAVSSLDQIGEMAPMAARALDAVLRPPVMGGGEQVGSFEPRLHLASV
ncbi:MAG TPA: asparaginase [Acidimicrobiia bacterium]|nr:asparaginase [Acidimicrobiia bacterium]